MGVAMMTPPPVIPPRSPLDVLYVDEHLIVVNKPSGLLVHRGWDDDRDVALTLVRDALGARVNPVHRLDRATSGALVFARTAEMTTALGALFAEGGVGKSYRALVRGVPPAEGVIDNPVPRREGGPRVPAVTRYRLLATSPRERCSLVLALPETGRLHQVRRHLKHLGHPLIGDVNYGKGDLNRHFRATYQLHRLALHACTLAFTHPATGEPLRIVAPMPADLAAPLVALGLGDFVHFD
jgi:tRNA pseudouridine65 synthase